MRVRHRLACAASRRIASPVRSQPLICIVCSQLNIANPLNGAQVTIEIEDERKLAHLWDRRIAQEIQGDLLGEEFRGYVFRIAGGCDKQGFPMKQGIMVPSRIRLLLGREPGFWRPNRDGALRRRSVRGCVVAQDIAVLNLIVAKSGETVLPGLDRSLPRRLGPKRASKIRKLFNLSKADDVRKYVIRRELPAKVPKEGEAPKKKASTKLRSKAPKIQRLITPARLQHKRYKVSLQKRWSAKSREEAAAYEKMLAARQSASNQKAIKSEKKSEKKAKAAPVAAAPVAAPLKGKAAKVATKAAAKAAAAAAPAKVAAKPAAAAAPAKAAAKKGKGGKKQ